MGDAGPPVPSAVELLNALPSPTLLLDGEGGVLLANAAAEAFLNLSQAHLVERGWRGLFAEGSPVVTLIDEARRTGQGVQAYDVPVAFAIGREVSCDLLVGQAQLPGRWLTVSFQPRAVTALVERQMGQSAAARTAVGAAAMLAHEIKNPLSGIRGAAQLLQETDDPEARELADLIVTEADRVRALIDRMEGFTDERPRRFAPENIHAILSHVRRLAETGFGRDHVFAETYDPSLPPVLGDRDRLVQAMLNLVKNAVEASPPGGTITLRTAYRTGIRVRPAGSSGRVSLPLEIAVIDEGDGPPPHVADHLFEPFVTGKRGGTGLGLALVAKVVGDHGGVVEFERRDGRTIFRVRLPVVQEPAAVPPLAAETA
ncbi:two-component system sensor histidine kinase NtrB [Thermaurantiacus tibetensis]|uniref:two-component system sensor histidine kinase NtrB n=1 Tax=Thermaurantiacus tibetensis TaxID=2759035 RepID=UPI00188FB8C8|nr:ATP-binding protein [Thermaurantiacus tibetensis]